MYLYIEMWNVTTKWMKLDRNERRKLMDDMHGRIKNMRASGVENLGWARNDEHTPYRSDYRYMTVWKMPSKAEVEALESNLKKVGWYDYFSQANSRGEMILQEDAIDFLVDIEENSTSMS
ncbi:DUF6616 family protein [Christiangramia forsetii]|uniref:Uncharacterized protein n=2 Tax=Christiangramia forsetii TaxID=411153 RepID=A0M6D5_CHRFK|nr:DUF6616 family protein [Christiangramia forsetii]GGG30680.1 hypothetical protein GCM10011532_12760 [Christiangramia forsetii]CAL68180.1 hypothetical protein GFO_3237 [Christiangramia forsetii KT0803]